MWSTFVYGNSSRCVRVLPKPTVRKFPHEFYYCTIFKALSNTSNTRKSVSSDVQTLRSGLKTRGETEFFLNQLRSVWLSDETLFRVFDRTSQSIDNS